MESEKVYNLDVFSSIHEPYWIETTNGIKYHTLKDDINVDVAIVGGGITGLTAAFLLKNKGLKVAILEANRIAHGTTGHTTAKITSQHNLIYDKIISKFGEEKARQYAEANESAIKFIANLVKEKNIDCDFCWRPAYVYTQSDYYIGKIENEVKAARGLGIKASYEDNIQLPFNIKAAIKFDNQAQFHPLKYLLAIAKEIPGSGSEIFEFTKVVDIKEADKCTVLTEKGKKVIADKVIIASHFPCYDGRSMYFARIYPERSYVLGIKIKEKFPEGMFITAEDPVHSLRSQKDEDGEIVLIGGGKHKTGNQSQTQIHYKNLGDFAKKSFHLEEILYRWSTQDCMTVDDVPYVGYCSSKTSNIFVATGFGKWGMTNSTAAANILTDLIVKGESPWSPVYNPSRFDISASGTKLVCENVDVAEELIKGKIAQAPKDVEINIGEAKIIIVDGEKVGAYRDEKGDLHMVDITCTHLGCELVWNEAEKTWDCPCHGSRFSYDGSNVEGPAFNTLKHRGEWPNKKDANIF
ncbi:Glycine/D-amino acid oxidase [Clostridium acidisoli DSM 12555]|uniref:Glycine/D-amino acid oxidase n=1 Tax=Clostridium acidisoli DSM 12555 TaxID=1121291 RepID=A0A1W1X9D9_9CLOT|nr:FAD-dependent oxidoreductase [Clostridium acidisoli]SMC20131.1 Glycine/D-amino acid oxidase [Clostridium acidisoli DSM 12555]